MVPLAMLYYVAVTGGLDALGLYIAIAFSFGAIFAVVWFSSKKVTIDDQNIELKMLLRSSHSVPLSQVSSVDRDFKWTPLGKTIGASSTLTIGSANNEPLIIPIEDFDESDIQLLIRKIVEHRPGVKMNKLSKKTYEKVLSQSDLLTSNWTMFVSALVVTVIVVMLIGIMKQLFR